MNTENKIKEEHFNDKQCELRDVMNGISEDCYCAGWMIGLEYAIWNALQSGDRKYGMGEIDENELERCRVLSSELDGWIIWIDDLEIDDLPVNEWGPYFVSMGDWLEMLKRKAPAARKNGGTIHG